MIFNHAHFADQACFCAQDKADDAPAGIRSTALLFGDRTRPILAGFSASSLGLITLSGILNSQGIPFFLGVGAAGIQLAKTLKRTDFDDRTSCWKGFVDCGTAGAMIWAGQSWSLALQERDSVDVRGSVNNGRCPKGVLHGSATIVKSINLNYSRW